MDGITMGGGVGISVHAPFRIATENTTFAMPEGQIGFFPDVGSSFFLPRLDGNLGSYFALTGDKLKGKEVLMAGIATHYVPSSRLPQLLLRIQDLDSDDMAVFHQAIDEFVESPSLKEWKSFLTNKHDKVLRECFGQGDIGKITTALRSFADSGNEFAAKAIKLITENSPTSCIASVELLNLGSNMHFADCFNMEYALAQGFLEHPDFTEGVSAKLIQKRKDPNWQPTWKQVLEDPLRWKESVIGSVFKGFRCKTAEKLDLLNPSTFFDYPHRTLSAFPREQDVLRVMNGTQLHSRKVVPLTTKDEVFDYFMVHWANPDWDLVSTSSKARRSPNISGGHGRGKQGLKECVEAIYDRIQARDGSSKL